MKIQWREFGLSQKSVASNYENMTLYYEKMTLSYEGDSRPPAQAESIPLLGAAL